MKRVALDSRVCVPILKKLKPDTFGFWVLVIENGFWYFFAQSFLSKDWKLIIFKRLIGMLWVLWNCLALDLLESEYVDLVSFVRIILISLPLSNYKPNNGRRYQLFLFDFITFHYLMSMTNLLNPGYNIFSPCKGAIINLSWFWFNGVWLYIPSSFWVLCIRVSYWHKSISTLLSRPFVNCLFKTIKDWRKCSTIDESTIYIISWSYLYVRKTIYKDSYKGFTYSNPFLVRKIE